MSQDRTFEGEGATQSCDPLQEAKKMAGLGLMLNLILGGLSMLLLYWPEIRGANPFLARLNAWIFASGFVCPVLLFIMAKVTHRAVYCILVNSFVIGYIGWFLLLMGLGLISEGVGGGGMSMGMPLLLFGVACAPAVGFMEWKFVPWYWHLGSKSGRMDLRHALFHTDRPPCNISDLPPYLRIQVPFGITAAVVTGVGLILRSVGGSLPLVLVGVVSFVTAIGIVVMAWGCGFSIFFRMLRWERANGRKIRVAPIERGESVIGGPLRKGKATRKEGAAGAALQSYNPLEIPRKHLGIGIVLNLILGGIITVCLLQPEVKEAHPFLARWNLWILTSAVVGPLLLLMIAEATRRAIYCVLLANVGFGCLGAYSLLIGLFLLYKESGAGSLFMGMPLLSFGVAFVLVVGLMEWKLVPWIWQQNSKSGRMDLEHALYRPEMPPYDITELPSYLWIQVPLVAGAVATVAIRMILRRLTGEGASLVVEGVLFLVVAFALAVGTWSHGFSIFFRMLRWEWANGRKIRIAPIERGEKQGLHHD